MSEKNTTPPRPSEPPAEGYTWVYDPGKGWYEVEMEIRMPGEQPFHDKSKPLTWPDDVTPPRPQNPN